MYLTEMERWNASSEPASDGSKAQSGGIRRDKQCWQTALCAFALRFRIRRRVRAPLLAAIPRLLGPSSGEGTGQLRARRRAKQEELELELNGAELSRAGWHGSRERKFAPRPRAFDSLRASVSQPAPLSFLCRSLPLAAEAEGRGEAAGGSGCIQAPAHSQQRQGEQGRGDEDERTRELRELSCAMPWLLPSEV
jgi:hypothetical protein